MVKADLQTRFYTPTKEQKENWQSGINQLEESGTAGRNIASYSKGVINSLRSMSQSVEKTACDPFGTIRETKRSFQIDPSRFNPFYRAGNYLAGLYQAGNKGDWESFSYKLGQATPNIAVTAASAGIGQGVARSIAPGGINVGSGINSFATSNGALIGTGTLEGISVSATDVALAGAASGGTVTTPGIAYSSSFNNNNGLNNTLNSNGKTSQGNSGGGGKDVTQANESSIKNIYDSIKKAPQYPEDFKNVVNGTRKVNIKNNDVLDELRKVESGQWKKIYKDGYNANGSKISIHYFQSQSGKVFNVKVKPGWSNK